MMASLNGTLLLTKGQIKRLAKGKAIYITRGGKDLFIGAKTRFSKERRLIEKIADLKQKLVSVRGGDR